MKTTSQDTLQQPNTVAKTEHPVDNDYCYCKQSRCTTCNFKKCHDAEEWTTCESCKTKHCEKCYNSNMWGGLCLKCK